MDRTSVGKGKGAIGALLVTMCVFLIPRAAYSQAPGYAVEVAAMRSQESAVGLTDGLIARGYDAYWVKAGKAKSGVIYRVRLGSFPTLDFARKYAESLLDSGLLNACAITLNRPQDPAAKSDTEPEELSAVLNKARWGLSANRKIAYSLPPRGPSSSARSAADIVVLMRTIEGYGWRLRTDPEILAQAASGKLPAVAAARGTKPNAAAAIPSALDTVAAEFDKPAGREAAGNPELASAGGPSPRQTAGPLSSPRLSGSVEMRDGRLVMILKNLDRQRAFNGLASVTLNDGKIENYITPVVVNLQPSEEKLVPLDDPSKPYGDSVLVVYDVKRAVQLIRSVPFGNRPNVTKTNQQPIPEPEIANIETGLQLLGEDDPSPSDPATPANPEGQNKSLKVTSAFEGEIEGAPAQKIPKPGN